MKTNLSINQIYQTIVYHLVMNPLQPSYIEPTVVTTTPQTEEPAATNMTQTGKPNVTAYSQTGESQVTNSSEKVKNGSADVGMIVGIVFGVIAFLLLIALLLLFFRRSRTQPKYLNRDIE